MTLHMGKLPATYDSRDLHYANVRPKGVTIPQVPYAWGRGRDFADGPPPAGWGMMGNGPVDDSSLPASWTAAQGGCGDCTNADPAHAERMAAHDAGRAIPASARRP